MFVERTIESNGSLNKSIIEWGKRVSLVLSDYLNYLDGPRVRDLVSHAEIHPDYVGFEFQKHFYYYLLFILFYLFIFLFIYIFNFNFNFILFLLYF